MRMELRFVREWKSIQGSVTDEAIADFVVLSGPNGSGKSHLLQAIARQAIHVTDSSLEPGARLEDIRIFVITELIPAPDGGDSLVTYHEPWVQLQKTTADALKRGIEQGIAGDQRPG